MDEFTITGGRPLEGQIRISGNRLSALTAMAVCLMAEGRSILAGLPQLPDIRAMSRLLEELGCEARQGDATPASEDCGAADPPLQIVVQNATQCEARYEIVKRLRASALVIGALLARRGRVVIAIPGASAIGDRDIGLHLPALEQLGARFHTNCGNLIGEVHGRLKGCRVSVQPPGSKVNTINALCAATLAEDQTILQDAAIDPEIIDCAAMLNAMGGRISGAGTSELRIEGVEVLHGCEHRIMPDPIECGTFMIAAAITGGDLELRHCDPRHVGALIGHLRDMGVEVVCSRDSIRVRASRRLTGLDVTAEPFPGFSTDLQPPMTALLCLANGASRVSDTVFPTRLRHAAKLNQMGADIAVQGDTAEIRGVEALRGADMMAADSQEGVALVLAGLAARGTTQVDRVYHIDRRYAALEQKLAAVGAKIERVKHD